MYSAGLPLLPKSSVGTAQATSAMDAAGAAQAMSGRSKRTIPAFGLPLMVEWSVVAAQAMGRRGEQTIDTVGPQFMLESSIGEAQA